MREFLNTRSIWRLCGTLIAACSVSAISLAQPTAAMDFASALDSSRTLFATAWATSCQWTIENYGRAPGMIVGLAVLLLLPLLALGSGLIAHFALPQPTATPARRGDEKSPWPLPDDNTAPDQPSYLAWPREAWLTGSTTAEAQQPPLLQTIPRELLSIGRGEDNDLVLDEATVHRYHAVIQRTSDALFLIKDLGGSGGNGVRVNDERVTEAHLLDADRIMLGAVTLVFHARRVGTSNLDVRNPSTSH
jgi:pSer/pThr/pTyr-binding forkhead associated (FHA) protein